ncbi:MAG TPA: UDP-N-acetylglucosamine--N-acetylmuramyl-(pentapeptide) pyrophosphoryl-undecaprenol N-acetylglucosamine transferase [Acidimicrobiales bacterium]|nr:UDP-N-acetylglucosamine--N-acetylmuramyl-(pentapeptide) pyrophosphoryl-undecaprenol N-acetylglucosamine transferase [Acidimicrobiales bacterium]
MTRAGGTWAVIAGGGTAGHVVPAVAIAQALVERGHPRESIHFVGSKRGIDARLVGAAGFDITLLPGRGLARKLTLDNLQSLLGFAVALVRSVVLLARMRPAVVVSMGGYAAAPVAFAARLFRVPVVISEQNAVPTATHRLVARFAVASAVPADGTPLPHPVTTGNPVRAEVLSIDSSDEGRRKARTELGLPLEATVIAAVGGSLGSRTINEAVLELAGRWADRPGLAIRHAVGDRDWADVSGRLPAAVDGGLVYQAIRYEERMPLLLAAADLVISRAGGTVWEIAVVGRASILVPLPIAPFDHQAANAQVLVRAGAAIMLRDPEVTADRLATEVDSLFATPGRLAAMGEAARGVAHPDAADRVAAVVEQHAKRQT